MKKKPLTQFPTFRRLTVSFHLSVILVMAVLAGTIVCAACSSDDDNKTGHSKNFTEKLMGRWMCTIVDGNPCVTNYNYVLNFISPTKAYRSYSPNANMGMSDFWENRAECSVNIAGKVTVTAHYDTGLTSTSEYNVVSITEDDMVAMVKHNITYNGKEIFVPEHNTERFKKVTKDYAQDIIGTWEGRITSEESEYDDGKLHRWEYKTDGNYVYYTQNDDGQWISYDNTYAQYFVDGVLLCSRWKNNGEDTEQREWWEIVSIKDGVMKWTALRRRDNGSTYTASFQMTKVQ